MVEKKKKRGEIHRRRFLALWLLAAVGAWFASYWGVQAVAQVLQFVGLDQEGALQVALIGGPYRRSPSACCNTS
jgi:hypothetical protein